MWTPPRHTSLGLVLTDTLPDDWFLVGLRLDTGHQATFPNEVKKCWRYRPPSYIVWYYYLPSSRVTRLTDQRANITKIQFCILFFRVLLPTTARVSIHFLQANSYINHVFIRFSPAKFQTATQGELWRFSQAPKSQAAEICLAPGCIRTFFASRI